MRTTTALPHTPLKLPAHAPHPCTWAPPPAALAPPCSEYSAGNWMLNGETVEPLDKTPLHVAVEAGDVAVARVLLEAGRGVEGEGGRLRLSLEEGRRGGGGGRGADTEVDGGPVVCFGWHAASALHTVMELWVHLGARLHKARCCKGESVCPGHGVGRPEPPNVHVRGLLVHTAPTHNTHTTNTTHTAPDPPPQTPHTATHNTTWTPTSHAHLPRPHPHTPGANPNIPDYGQRTPLLTAVEEGDCEMLGLLLEHGANVSAACQDFPSAVHPLATR